MSTGPTDRAWEVFPKAPIVEAILDLRTALPSDVSADGLRAFHDGIRDAFPNKEEQFEIAAQMVLSPGPASAVIQQRREPDLPTHVGYAAIALDIDVFRELRIGPREEAVWSTLDKLRDFKNRIFFGATTDKAREAFR